MLIRLREQEVIRDLEASGGAKPRPAIRRRWFYQGQQGKREKCCPNSDYGGRKALVWPCLDERIPASMQ